MSTDVLTASALERWQREPIAFVEQVLRNPETGAPFELFDAQRTFFEHAFKTNDAGRLAYPEQVFACPKKSGKTGTAAMHLLTTTLLFGGRFAEGYAVANDLEQAQGRVFQAAARICEASPLLAREVEITQREIRFKQTGAVIRALGGSFADIAGANPVISSFDELWGYTSERSRRLFDEMVPSPARKISCRLVTSYAGFTGESVLLEELYKRGLAQPQIGPSLHAGDGLLLAWHHEPVAPWQDESWLAEMRRSLRPNQYLRMIENGFVTTESSFVDMTLFDRCIYPDTAPAVSDKNLAVFIGIDAGFRHDATAIVVCSWNKKTSQVHLIFHRIFTPTDKQPLNFQDIENTVFDLARRFSVHKVLFDPNQMIHLAQRLDRANIRTEAFPQTVANLTAASQNLFELINGGNLVMYPDAAIRTAVSRAVATETSSGWKIDKSKRSDRIDVVIALAMAAYAAVKGQNDTADHYMYYMSKAFGPDTESPSAKAERERVRKLADYNKSLLERYGQPGTTMPR